MQYFVRIVCVVGALLLIGYGMLLPVEQDTRWLLALWLAAPLLLLAARLSLPTLPRGLSRSMTNLGLVIGLGFLLLSMQLLRQQFVLADATYNYTYTDQQTGQTVSNVRPVLQSLRIQRGKMLDRNGGVLVDTKLVDRGFAVRTYPLAGQNNPAAFSNVVGYFSDRYGPTGLEATYNEYLSGQQDTFGKVQNTLTGQAQVGDDLHLTIDARLQEAAMNILGNRTGSIIVIDPNTGAVRAMASAPGFDPSKLVYDPSAEDTDAENASISAYWQALNDEGSGQPLINRPTQGRYPPGSTFKTVTAIGALEHPNEGKPNDIQCFNSLNTESGAPPVVNAVNNLSSLTGDPSSLERVYAFSCNVAFAQYALRLGPDLLSQVAAQFDIYRPEDAPTTYNGFTDLRTAPSLLYTNAGYLNSKPALADTGYGQGQMFVTPLQMAMIAAAVGNKDGLMMEPYLVEQVTRPDGSVVVAHNPRAIRQAVPPAIAATMRANMRAGVAYGFGKPAQQIDPSIALVGGKSGTAEHNGPNTHAWFIAIAPVDQPRYAVVAMIENGGEGSSVGAKAAGDVLAAAFQLEK